LNGINTYSGRTITASNGAIIVSQDRNFGAVPTAPLTDAITLAANGILRANGTFTVNANRSIGIGSNGGGAATGFIDVTSGQTLTVAGTVTNRTLNADGSKITGVDVGSLTKTGAGTLVLAGQNNYSGNTTVSTGTLVVSGSITGLASANPAVSVASGASLQLSGSGSISATTASLSNTSKLTLEVGTLTANTISLSGAATLAGTVSLALNLTADPTDGTLFTLIDGNAALKGYDTGARFAVNGVNVNDGGTFTINSNGFSQAFQINYGNGSADVTILAIPEPASAAMLAAAGVSLLSAWRFRRKKLQP
jgi:autotransporter-associated beta strand protein